MRANLYCDRDICGLDEIGGFYSRHVSAMTSESLNGKSKIAAELAYRDSIIEALKADRDAQQKRADALAVENAEMRNALDSIRIYSSDTLSGPSDSVPDMAGWLREGVENLHHISNVETPATSAALAAIEARGVEKFLDSGHCSQEAHGCVCRYLDELREAK